uniref:Uncharacterized protein n=1 Tax=Triticum urartu TaxID=4572 RepID=A0A8R7K0D1_TRIUA
MILCTCSKNASAPLSSNLFIFSAGTSLTFSGVLKIAAVTVVFPCNEKLKVFSGMLKTTGLMRVNQSYPRITSYPGKGKTLKLYCKVCLASWNSQLGTTAVEVNLPPPAAAISLGFTTISDNLL